MSSLLTFDIVTTDLKTLESNLKKEVKSKFTDVVWDERPYEVEVDWNTYYKLYGVGETSKTKSTRKCLDHYRSFKKSLGESTKYVVGI
jgi:hypothetical protein|tara:strand:+ start:253 stop:516 length:264 start_codon:yes stop_codon:yes gene_type:complete